MRVCDFKTSDEHSQHRRAVEATDRYFLGVDKDDETIVSDDPVAVVQNDVRFTRFCIFFVVKNRSSGRKLKQRRDQAVISGSILSTIK